MEQLSQKDLIIIKQSQNWASRSISKLRSLTDKKSGRDLRAFLDKGVVIRDQLRDIWDDLVSRETVLDNKALNTFVSLRFVLETMKTSVENIIVPSLEKDGIDIRSHYHQEEAQEVAPEKGRKGKEIPKENKEAEQYDLYIKQFIADVAGAAVPEGLETQQKDTVDKLNFTNDLLNKSKNPEKSLKIYNDAEKIYENYKNLMKSNMEKKISEKPEDKNAQLYVELIKNAADIETSSYYYMVSMGDYGMISTRLKDKVLPVKQIIPFVREKSDIYSYRKATIRATKELLMFAKVFVMTIQKAITEKNQLNKWVIVIDGFNKFADEYNARVSLFGSFYDALAIKAKYDKMLKMQRTPKKKDKDKGNNYTLENFENYNWQEMPSTSKYKFKLIEHIKL